MSNYPKQVKKSHTLFGLHELKSKRVVLVESPPDMCRLGRGRAVRPFKLDRTEDRASTARIDNVEFVVADAQTHAFAPGTFDLVVSQFGLMFFDDPVGAFSNLRRSLAPGGRLAFVSWQGIPANEWLTVIASQVAKCVEIPEFGGLSNGPGMFALMDQDETTTLLEAAGFTEVAFESLAPTILIGGGGTVDQSMEFLLGMGMARGLVGLAGTDAHDEVVEAVRLSLTERYEPGVGVQFGAGAWIVTALT